MANVYDVCIVGAGPSGSTCAYYLAGRGLRVLVLEKKAFPRDKLCGDAVCTRAQTHLERMGVLQEIVAEGKGKWAEVGGIVSPAGIRYIGNSAPHTNGSLVIAVKRIVLDEKIARTAARAGAELVENYQVVKTNFDKKQGVWTVQTRSPNQPEYQARVLVLADGASSSLARSMGLVDSAPDAVCSRCYIKADTTNFDADGVMFYPRHLLPGYCALFREAGGDINMALYIIPGGPTVPSDLNRVFEDLLHNDPHVSAALGPNAQLGRMQGGALRLGGIPKSYMDHLLVIGDAAGHIDPLTGEGIHYAMDAAEMAAQTLTEAFAAGDFRASFLQRYQTRWQKSFGWDFKWSRRVAEFCGKHPVFLDAFAAVAQRRGPSFLAEWATVMTGLRPKTHFLRPGLSLPILAEAGRQWYRQRKENAAAV